MIYANTRPLPAWRCQRRIISLKQLRRVEFDNRLAGARIKVDGDFYRVSVSGVTFYAHREVAA